MKRIGILAIGALFFSHAAAAATWSIISITVDPQNAAAVTKAADALMNSELGKEFPGRLFLQVNLADGDNPATHSFVPVYGTAAEREGFGAKLQADPAWATFQKTMSANSQPVSNVMYRTQQRWGEISDDDVIWRLHNFNVRDPAAFAAALDTFLNSKTGKKFPGQVFLSSVVAGGISPVSHVISVGQVSEAAIEEWETSLRGNADWATYLETSQNAAEYLGNNMVRTLKTWGAPLDEVTAP
jgi:hypothetical protein